MMWGPQDGDGGGGKKRKEKKKTRKELRFLSIYPSPEIVRGALFLDLI